MTAGQLHLDLNLADPHLRTTIWTAIRCVRNAGCFGIFGHPDAAAITALGLHALQHRGQEAAGIVSFGRRTISFRTPARPRRRHLPSPAAK